MKWIKVSNDLESPYESIDWDGSKKKYFELGLELATTHLEVKRMKNQGLIDEDDVVIVSTDRRFLYENEFNVIDYKEFLRIYPKKEPKDFIDLTKNAFESFTTKLLQGKIVNSVGMYNRWNEDIKLIENINYSNLNITKDEKYFVVHVRVRKHDEYRNVSLEYWRKLINQLVKNYHIKCYVFGEMTEELLNNRTILGVDNMRDYATLLHREECQFFVGSTSGGSMITQLCCLEDLPVFIIDTSLVANTGNPMDYDQSINFAGVDFKIIKLDEIDELFETIRTKMKIVKELKNSKKVKVDVHVICYNEEAIIPFIKDYYKLFANNIYVYNNMSTDSSIELLKQLPKVEVIDFDTNNENSEQTLTDLRNSGWKKSIGKADFVLVCDMDEVIYSPKINEELLKLKNDGVTICKFNFYNMYSEKLPEYTEDKLYHQLNPMGCNATGWKEALVFNPNEIIDINYTPGKHEYSPVGNIKVGGLESKILTLHLKNIDLEMNIEKNAKYAKRQSKNNILNKWSVHYATPKEEYRRLFYQELKKCVDVNEYFKKKYVHTYYENKHTPHDKSALTPYTGDLLFF